MSDKLRWGIIGAGNIARALAAGVLHSKTGKLVAVASRTQEKADAFAKEHEADHGELKAYAGYDNLLADKDVDAVYIATPHPQHAEWSIKAAEAGKHILCEKPLTVHSGEAMAVIEAARRNDVFLMEAFMYRCSPLTAKLVELVKSGVIGEVRVIRANFGFNGGFDPERRLFNNDLAGGSILDVGCYATSMARLVAGAALGIDGPAEPTDVTGSARIGETGVDEWAVGTLKFKGDIIAQIGTSVRCVLDNHVQVFGDKGNLLVTSPWFATGKEGGKATIRVSAAGKDPEEVEVETDQWLYSLEADAVGENIAKRQAPTPGVTWDDTLGNMKTLDKWRAAVGCTYEMEKPEALLTPVHGRPLAKKPDAPMSYARIPSIDKDIANLIMGNDNDFDARTVFPKWDDYFELGGNAFDTAWMYGEPKSRCLGQWIKNRGIRDELVLIVKGAHTPDCYPDKLRKQFHQALEWLGIERTELYFMHRDNLDVPVGEFIDAMDELKRDGLIDVFGGSNWSLARIDEANAYAAKNGKQGFGATSNNLSLAMMIDPIWKGCIHISDRDSLKWYEQKQMANFAWSSQARGFFVEGLAAPDKLDDKGLVQCWYSDDNFKRLERAKELAKKKGVRPINIAAAYVTCQPFPSFALVGPRTMNETWTSMPACQIKLSKEELNYLAYGE